LIGEKKFRICFSIAIRQNFPTRWDGKTKIVKELDPAIKRIIERREAYWAIVKFIFWGFVIFVVLWAMQSFQNFHDEQCRTGQLSEESC
jgi:hypothetical protein